VLEQVVVQVPSLDKGIEGDEKGNGTKYSASWSSRLQPTVAASIVEVEYMGAAAAVKEALWFRKLARDIGHKSGGVQILCDN
jgi:hypothetical protein